MDDAYRLQIVVVRTTVLSLSVVMGCRAAKVASRLRIVVRTAVLSLSVILGCRSSQVAQWIAVQARPDRDCPTQLAARRTQ